jgi:regulator of protease activity HflC (stomatin/prohibitin superfamily)
MFNNKARTETTIAIIVIVAILILIPTFLFGSKMYKVWALEKDGQAELAKAEWEKKIAIEEAKAEKESATLKAEAEVERAKGVAEANKIIGDSLKNNDAYLRYLWIDKIGNNDQDVIYVPTEANLPILEASRFVSSD